MSADGSGAGSPPDEAPQELSADDLTSVPQAPIARQAAPSRPQAPAPRLSVPKPPPRATPSPPHVDAPQIIRGPRNPTLVGMGRTPRVDETERVVAGPPSPLETQRRLVEPVSAPLATIEPVISEPAMSEPVISEADIVVSDRPSTPSADSGNTVVHPPVAPPKPAEVVVADAPKVVVDAPGAVRVVPDELKETSISLRRVQLQQDAASSGEHATVIDPSRRARGRAIVAIVLGACGVLLLTGLVVAWARGRHKTDDSATEPATSSATPALDPKATTASTAKEPADDTTAASSTTIPTTAGATKSATVPKGFGRLTVAAAPGKSAPAGAQIFIEGKSYGALGDPLVVPCGYRWILAGKADAKGHLVARLSKSVSVFVQCGASSDTHFKLTLK